MESTSVSLISLLVVSESLVLINESLDSLLINLVKSSEDLYANPEIIITV